MVSNTLLGAVFGALGFLAFIFGVLVSKKTSRRSQQKDEEDPKPAVSKPDPNPVKRSPKSPSHLNAEDKKVILAAIGAIQINS